MTSRGRSESVSLSGLQSLARKPWYLAWRAVERFFYRGRRYSIQPPWGHRVFTPWFQPPSIGEFDRAYSDAVDGGPMAVSSDRCFMLWQFLRQATLHDGSVVECGVFQGGTAHLMAATLSAVGDRREVHLFDSFEGMPASSSPERDYHTPGDFCDTSVGNVQRRLAAFPNVRFHPGFIPDTFEEMGQESAIAFAHVDLDIYPSTVDACRWLWPRMVPGGIIVFDDYGFFPYRAAAKAAVDECFTGSPEHPLILPTGQAMIVKASI